MTQPPDNGAKKAPDEAEDSESAVKQASKGAGEERPFEAAAKQASEKAEQLPVEQPEQDPPADDRNSEPPPDASSESEDSRMARQRAIGGTLFIVMLGSVALTDVWRAGDLVLHGSEAIASDGSAVWWKSLLVMAAAFMAWALAVGRTRRVLRDPAFERLGRASATLTIGFFAVHAGIAWRAAFQGGAIAGADALASFAASAPGVAVYVVGFAALCTWLELVLRDQLPTRVRWSAILLAVAFFALASHALGALTVGQRLFGGAG